MRDPDKTEVARYRTGYTAPGWLSRTGRDFRTFVLRGNMVELAVAVVVGAASSAVVQAIVADLLTPVIAAVYHQHDFARMTITVGSSQFRVGHLLNAVMSWLMIALVVFLLVVKPVNALRARSQTELDVGSRTRACPECLSQIPVLATRCAFCTAKVPPDGATAAMAIVHEDRPSVVSTTHRGGSS